MTEEAMTYLTYILDNIQRFSVKRDQMDWSAWRQEILAMAADAQTTADIYPAIKTALRQLNDHHSYFLEPAAVQLASQGVSEDIGIRSIYPSGIVEMVFPGSPAEQAGVQIGEIITAFDDRAISSLASSEFYAMLRKAQVTLTLVSANQQQSRQISLQAAPYSMHRAPQGRRLAHNIGYIQLPELRYPRGEDRSYVEAVHQLLREIDQVETSGWIIDLRHNPGGNLWGTLASLGPLFGEDEWLIFVGPEAKITARYQNGQAIAKTEGVISQIANRYQGVISQAANPYQLKRPNPPIALLIGPFTGSAAEILLLRFYGRPHTRSFGEPTWGVPTAVETEPLSDGAQLCLTKALSVDFVGQTYESSILPEQEIAIDWTQIGTNDDPVLQAALRWLQTEEGCY